MSEQTALDQLTPATLTITRNAPDDVQDRWVRLHIDDGPEEILRFGDVLSRPLAPGVHRIRAHNTLSRDMLEFTAQAGEQIRVRCLNRFSRGSAIMLLTIGFGFISVRLHLDGPG